MRVRLLLDDNDTAGLDPTLAALVSPYFVPGRRGTKTLVRVASSGVKVKILTNALESTDVAAVHSGYARRRRDLLKAGIELYELRRDAREGPPSQRRTATDRRKPIAVDAERIFIGSLNFDPRSAVHNTELGLVIDSPSMAGALSRMFLKNIPDASYQVQFGPYRKLQWLERRADGTTLTHHNEPGASLGRRLAVTVLGVLPIEGLL